MNLDELQSVRDRERQTDKPQQLRESFYSDAGEFIQQLQTERDRAADRADDPFDSTEVRQLTDKISTAEQTVEAIYEKRVGKIVKAASFDAADLPAETDGLTPEEFELFEELVEDIKTNRQQVLAVLDGNEPKTGTETTKQQTANDPAKETQRTANDRAAANPSARTETPSQTNEIPPDAAETPSQTNEIPPDAAENPQAHAEAGETQPPGTATHNPETVSSGPQSEANAPGENRPDSTKQSPSDRDSVSDSPASTPTESVSVADAMGGDTTQESPPQGAEQEASHTSGEGTAEQPVRKDGGTGPADESTTATPSHTAQNDPQHTPEIERETVRIVDDVDTFVGFDERDYDLDQNDVVTLPSTNADILLERGVAEQLE